MEAAVAVTPEGRTGTVPARACPLCGSVETHRLFRPVHAPGPVARCRVCGLVYVTPVENRTALIDDGPVLPQPDARWLASRDLNALDGCWESEVLAEKEREWPALRQNSLDALARLARFASPPGRLLDFGCGGGFFLAVAQERGWDRGGATADARGRLGDGL